MKNYVKVVLGTKNIGIFPFEDTDEEATREATTRAENAKMNGARIVAWTLTGHMARRNLPTVGREFDTARGTWV